MRAHPARAIVGAVVISLLAGGCVTKSAMMVGSAREVLTGFHEVQLAGRMLHVRYTTKTWYGPSRVLEGSPDRILGLQSELVEVHGFDNLVR